MPGRRLGQHFLYDPSILARIVETARLRPDDTVVEIGPGPGTLTRALAGAAARVVAIEIDRRLYERLLEGMASHPNVKLVHGDALRFPYETVGPFKVVANIPYQITTPLLFRLFEHCGTLESMTLTVQKEVAERITAGPGSKSYGVLSVMVQYRGEAEMAFRIPAGAFRPPPKVDSACVHIRVRKFPAARPRDEALFFALVKAAFSQRRKTVANALKPLDARVREALAQAGIEPRRRPETLSIGEYIGLADALSALRAEAPKARP